MNSALPCTFVKSSGLLTITNPVSSNRAGVDLKFTVNNFLNPYSAKPRTGYFVYTTDKDDGQIDSTRNHITITLTGVTQPADFKSVDITRNDDRRLVGMTSSAIFSFNLGLPMDAGCKLVIKFP